MKPTGSFIYRDSNIYIEYKIVVYYITITRLPTDKLSILFWVALNEHGSK